MDAEISSDRTELPNVYPWEQGNKVIELQTLLRSHGFDLRVDGDFGSRTETAVQSFQHRHGLRVDGVVGKLTWAALMADVQPGTRLLKLGSVGADVSELQGLLLVHGFQVCRNQIYDAATEAAVREFQHRSKLRETGRVDDTTWTFLRGRGLSAVPRKQNRWLRSSRKWWG
ncbi:MAG: peptidoglycan-binding protein [Leptolyngbya sp. Prado105]|jgi:peptidoglycan hydrolase-like protein with peptidoglycan-binding domain|nr:peptidoglycan-binding protein [Leptolyngbya sp. Prado105]